MYEGKINVTLYVCGYVDVHAFLVFLLRLVTRLRMVGQATPSQWLHQMNQEEHR